jgi:hypothetical protein
MSGHCLTLWRFDNVAFSQNLAVPLQEVRLQTEHVGIPESNCIISPLATQRGSVVEVTDNLPLRIATAGPANRED